MAWHSFFISVDMVGPIMTGWTWFWPKRMVLTHIDRVHSVLTKNDGFDPKWPETHFFIPVDMIWPVLIQWARFWSKMMVLTRNDMKLIFYPSRHGLTRIDLVDSVLMERCGWLEKNMFLNFKLFLNYFWIFMNNNRNKITFRKILVNPKLGYNTLGQEIADKLGENVCYIHCDVSNEDDIINLVNTTVAKLWKLEIM